MQRKRVQPTKKPVKRPTRKKTTKKPPVPFSEMVINWVIIILAVVILVFFASMLWKMFYGNKEKTVHEPSAQEPVEAVQEIIHLEVLNGCGVKGVAGQFTDYLRSQGFDVVNTGNYRNFDVDSSFVIDRRSMRLNYGKRIAESLGIKSNRVNRILSEELDLEATLVLGKDYRSLAGFIQ